MIGISATAGCERSLKFPPIRVAFLILSAACLSARATAQATQTVPPSDPVYGFIDRLVGARLVDTVIVGQRMMSRREIGRIIAEAKRSWGSDSGWFGVKITEYAREFPEAPSKAPIIIWLGAEGTAAESQARGIPPDGDGAIDVQVNPLLSNAHGRSYANGATLGSMTGASSPIGSRLVAEISSREARLDPRGSETMKASSTERLYARGSWKNLGIEVGRDFVYFGQGVTAGLTTSLDAPAIDQVRLASDRPFLFPWIFRRIGPTHGTIVLGDLGGDQFFPHTRFFAYKLSARPHPTFEVGATVAEQVGGQGAPGGTFGQKAGDAFPLLDATILHRNFLFSNKFVGMDARYTVPRVRGLQVYMEGAFDDFDLRRVKSVFTEDAGYVWGTSMSCFRECGPVQASAEYHVTGLRYYTHGIYKGGYTLDDHFIGDPLGPRGKAGYGFLKVDHRANSYGLDLAYEARSGNKYGAVSTTTDDSDFRFIILEHNPTERRWRAMGSFRRGRPFETLSYRVGAGVERVENFAFVDGPWRTNWMAQVGLEYRIVRRYR